MEIEKRHRLPMIILIIMATLLVSGGAFYWFSYRPSQIRIGCRQKSLDYIEEKEEKNFTWEVDLSNFVYLMCVRKSGLAE